MNRKAVYPGSFDPITYGHIDIIKRASRLYDTVYIAVARSAGKELLFTVKERGNMVKKATEGLKNVIVEDFNGLVVDYVCRKKSRVIIRGLRMISDFEYEFQMALTNRKLAGDVETIFMMPNERYSYLSSKLIKEVVDLGANVSDFVPDFVENALKKKLKKK
ncbi:MAG: pantetheine-phosphate adenylyltransferase [Candidatus Omnitrophica bacterium]|nr:pantetheine-phosphate adenylyltransferase [Candidatus Omnitrophota bacterium]